MAFIHFLLIMLLFVCILNTVYEVFKFSVAFYKTEEYKTTTLRRVLLCLSLSYIITVISFGIPV